MKVALVYDRINKFGGAERVLLALHRVFPNAPLYTSVYNPETSKWANVFTIKTSFLQKFSLTRSHHEYIPFLMPLAFESFTFDEYDVVISVTSEAAKGIITKPKTVHICLCLTPTRYLWSGYKEYFKNNLLRLVLKPFIAYLRLWDTIVSQRPDVYVAISEEVRERIKKYYGRESKVVYPPVTIDDPKVPKKTKVPKEKKEYFLVISRLSRFASYKRIDLAVKAATQLSLPLIVVGDGDSKWLKKIAGPSVQFVGKVSDKALARYFMNCQALIFPGKEDFGLVMAEALSFGKPVVAYGQGGALEIVTEGRTGMFFDQQTVSSLVEALKRFRPNLYNTATCTKEAEKFSEKRFDEGILRIISKVLKYEQ